MKAKLLLVEDSESQGNELARTLTAFGYEVQWVRTGVDALKLARTEAFDLIILDLVLADVDGISVCRWLRMDRKTAQLPIIMLTVKDELRDRIEGLNVGANDYLSKPFEAQELDARIYAALRVYASRMELAERNQQLEAMLRNMEALATTDPLTGLCNRRRFADVLQREFAATLRYQHGLCCILLDVDHFKKVNDTYGHDAGDRLLVEMAQVLAVNVRVVDLVARYGGEEFAILLPHTPKQFASVVGERIAGAARRLEVEAGHEVIRVTVSCGISSSEDVPSKDAEDLVRTADSALYLAKRNGRDRIEIFDPARSEVPFLSE